MQDRMLSWLSITVLLASQLKLFTDNSQIHFNITISIEKLEYVNIFCCTIASLSNAQMQLTLKKAGSI